MALTRLPLKSWRRCCPKGRGERPDASSCSMHCVCKQRQQLRFRRQTQLMWADQMTWQYTARQAPCSSSALGFASR